MIHSTLEHYYTEQDTESFLLTVDEHQELHVKEILAVGPVADRRLKVRGRFFPKDTASLEGAPLTVLISSLPDYEGYELKGTCEKVEPMDVVEGGRDLTLVECELTVEIEELHKIS